MKKIICACLLLASMSLSAQELKQMDLSGLWRFQTDPMGFGKTPGSELFLTRLDDTIVLPGSMDEGGKGLPNKASHIDRLSRKFEYQGAAWYQREVVIPADWQDRHIKLTLERCHWETTVYVDGQWVGADERLSAPNRFDMSKHLTPGVHTLTFCVDNTIKYPMDNWTHGITEYTQTNWNGIVGEMKLTVHPRTNLSKVNIFPDCDKHRIRVRTLLEKDEKCKPTSLTLQVTDARNRLVKKVEVTDFSSDSIDTYIELGKNLALWDEFSPNLYHLKAVLNTADGVDSESVRFGMRKLEKGQHHIRLNGYDIHLRGTLECAVFPHTGYPSTHLEDWLKILKTIKDYGMNHVRFHSWCPPEAAFDAADELGIYLQVELPMWIKDVGQYPARRKFFEKELYALLSEYGNHPSFLLFCCGNENEGDFSALEDLVKKGQRFDPRHLYSASTARTHVASDEYYVSHVTSKGGITVYEGYVNSDWDKNHESDIDVPVIAHEAGQRCMYPNFKEMSKYTGVLEPRNFQVYRERLTKNGMLSQADDFFKATGASTVLHYKEVIESLLRSSKSGGFQLLGLSDFPGQGCAFVGILDAFWESKGLISPEAFRRFCAPVVVYARMPKRSYTTQDRFVAKMGIYNFGPANISKPLQWSLVAEDGQVVAKGSMKSKKTLRSTVDSLGEISVPLQRMKVPGKYTLRASVGNVQNDWDIWIYPDTTAYTQQSNTFCRTWEEAKPLLEQGKNVLLIPNHVIGRRTQFAGHFWNPIMFKWNPMIVGTLIDHKHPAFKDFPTSYYADWQWQDILTHTTAVDLTGLPTLNPAIQSVDTYEENRKLGIAFEAAVGKGRLFVLCMDIDKDMAKRPASRQLLHSVENYVHSDQFRPTAKLNAYQLDELFGTDKQQNAVERNDRAIEQLLNK